MREDYCELSKKVLLETAGSIQDENEYYTLLGTVVLTAIIGKYPSREDRATFLGCQENAMRYLKRAVQHASAAGRGRLETWYANEAIVPDTPQAVVYAIATELLLEGYAFEMTPEEQTGRRLAGDFLRRYFRPQQIKDISSFSGFNIILEYVWYLIDGHSSMEFNRFVSTRYGCVPKKVATFCNIIAENATERGDNRFAQFNDYKCVVAELVHSLEEINLIHVGIAI